MNISTSRLTAYSLLLRVRPLGLLFSVVFLSTLISFSFDMGFITLSVAFLNGLFVCIASSGAFAINQIIERKKDAVMNRTANRPLVTDEISVPHAIALSLILFLGGPLLQFFFISSQTACYTLICGFIYAFIYTPLKYFTTFSTIIGSIPGAMLPLIGWSVSGKSIEFIVWWMSAMVYLWQIPHTLVIGSLYFKDYERAKVKLLTHIAGFQKTNKQILGYTALLMVMSYLPHAIAFMTYLSHGIEFNLYTLLLTTTLNMLVMHTTVKYCLAEFDPKNRFFFRTLIAYLPLILLFGLL